MVDQRLFVKVGFMWKKLTCLMMASQNFINIDIKLDDIRVKQHVFLTLYNNFLRVLLLASKIIWC